ncbi:MAG: hypothetical protein IJD82_07460 [Clostridia bacterium]|nr:hypothetical protein [Clostridia bacterium]
MSFPVRKAPQREVLIDCVAVFLPADCVIPGIVDYVCKDYVVYTGSFAVYTKRTKLVLGGE